MRKIILFLLTIAIVVSMAIPASAATPKLKVPSIKIPNISSSVEVKLGDGFWDNYFAKNPIRIKLG